MSRNFRHLLCSSLFALPLAIGGVPAAHAADFAVVLMGCATSASSPDEPKVTYVQSTVEGSVSAPAIAVGDPCSDALASLLRPGPGFESNFLQRDQFFTAPPDIAVMMYQVTITVFE